MPTSVHTLVFHGSLTQRGFWLYVWRIQSPHGEVLYVGRTGDSSSDNAQSPFNRMGANLNSKPNAKGNSLYRHLKRQETEPEQCGEFMLFAYGPVFDEPQDSAEFDERRRTMAALEQRLAQALFQAGYSVMNTVHNRMPLCSECWRDVHRGFQRHFADLPLDLPGQARQDYNCAYHR